MRHWLKGSMSRWLANGRRGEVAGEVLVGEVLAGEVLAVVEEVEGEEEEEEVVAAVQHLRAHRAHLVGLRQAHLQEVEVPGIQAQRGKLLRFCM
jgi:hypothetical protein